MSYLADILTEAGFQQVRTYIQSLPLEKLITVNKKFVSVTIVFTPISLELQNKRNLIPTILKSFLIY